MSFDETITKFFGLLFGAKDLVAICHLRPNTTNGWKQQSLCFGDAVAHVIRERETTANLYFRASSHDGSAGERQANCVQARALFVDIDYGEVGHKRKSEYDTCEEALAVMLTAPVKPAIAWFTGHGIQAAYLLKEPFCFKDGPGSESNSGCESNSCNSGVQPGSESKSHGTELPALERYAALGKKLTKMLGADSTFTAEHAYRVPMTLNHKPPCPEVLGELLWLDDSPRYSICELESVCAAYGVDDLVAKEEVPVVEASGEEGTGGVEAAGATAGVTAGGGTASQDGGDGAAGVEADEAAAGVEADEAAAGVEADEAAGGTAAETDVGTEGQNAGDEGGRDVRYEDLPEYLRDLIEHGDERSSRLFAVIGKMVRAGYSDLCIATAVYHGRDFVEKYDGRQDGLVGEVENCLAKIRSSATRVYSTRQAPPLRVYNTPRPVGLADCDALSPEFNEMLDRYEAAARITLASRVREAARFHEHVFQSHPAGVLESPCGAGKSVWALCHTALLASASNRHLYVVETVEALYNAAAMLEKLTDTPVGRVHGFNAEKCHELCGRTHTWKKCNPVNPKSVCRSCLSNSRCAFFTRDDQEGRPILCMTHNGFIRMLEEDAEVLKDATVIVDEDLSPFNNLHVSFDDLDRLQKHVTCELGSFFPCTSYAHRDELKQFGVGADVKAFARKHFVYRGQEETAGLGDVCDQLKQALRSGWRGSTGDASEREKASDTLVQLLNFFRPTAHGDAAYAYREGVDHGKRFVVAKRERFSLGVERRYRKLWMLNASAQLAPYQYPDDMEVYTCPDLPGNSHLVTLHVVRSNPTKTKQEKAIWLSSLSLCFGERTCKHEKVLLALDKDSKETENVRKMLRKAWDAGHVRELEGQGPEFVELQRGRIKGVNTAGDCTLAVLTAMATFTGIDDCALHAALHYRRTFPDTPHVYTASGSPSWPGGKMSLPAMRTYYALRSLDEIYQAIWRTAVRNDRTVEAIVALPDEHWLATLYRTVMPQLGLASAYKEKPGEMTLTVDGKETVFKSDFEEDKRMSGLGVLVGWEPGGEVEKQEVARLLDYTGNRPWEKRKGEIMTLIGDFFEPGSTVRVLKRKANA